MHWRRNHIHHQALRRWLCYNYIPRSKNLYSDTLCLQQDLSHLSTWFHKWLLHFSVRKCPKIPSQFYIYCIENTPLDWVPSFKYLWVLIDSKLKWTEQHQVSSKTMKVLNLLRRNLHHASRAAKIRTFTTLIRTNLEYVAPVWSPHPGA